MIDGIRAILEKKALRLAWIFSTKEALSRVPHYPAAIAGETPEQTLYQCPVCWLRHESRGTLLLRYLPYTADCILQCRLCNDLTIIPSRELEYLRT